MPRVSSSRVHSGFMPLKNSSRPTVRSVPSKSRHQTLWSQPGTSPTCSIRQYLSTGPRNCSRQNREPSRLRSQLPPCNSSGRGLHGDESRAGDGGSRKGRAWADPYAASRTPDRRHQRDLQKLLFQTRIVIGSNVGHEYAVSRDGRFLINAVLDNAASPITLLLNWKPSTKE